MIDRRLVMLIEKCGYVSQHGKRVYGTAALLHFLHRPIQSINLRDVERGKTVCQKIFWDITPREAVTSSFPFSLLLEFFLR